MSNDEIIRLIYDIERDVLDDYETDLVGDTNRQYGEMRGVHMMASVLIDEINGMSKDGDSND